MATTQAVPVKPEQAALLERLVAARDAAQREVVLALTAMTVGSVPDGATFSGVSVEMGLVFFTEPDAVPVE